MLVFPRVPRECSLYIYYHSYKNSFYKRTRWWSYENFIQLFFILTYVFAFWQNFRRTCKCTYKQLPTYFKKIISLFFFVNCYINFPILFWLFWFAFVTVCYNQVRREFRRTVEQNSKIGNTYSKAYRGKVGKHFLYCVLWTKTMGNHNSRYAF